MQFAQQNGVPIVPVMMQDNWRATEWLGLLTAGSLWTPLHDASTMQENLPRLVEQISKVCGTNRKSRYVYNYKLLGMCKSQSYKVQCSVYGTFYKCNIKRKLQDAVPVNGCDHALLL